MKNIPFYAKRFVAGVCFEEAISVIQKLNHKGVSVTLDVLGENIKDKAQAINFIDEYKASMKKIAEQKLNCYVSVKLTMLGLDMDPDFCYENTCQLLELADTLNMRVTLDMEGSDYTERTLSIYERVSKQFKSPEIVLQTYLHRTMADLDRVLAANVRLRLCKGAYKEPASTAYQKTSQIIENYKNCAQKALLSGNRVCIASHDDQIIDFCIDFIYKNNIPKERYEFQMLYGMREKTWYKITEQGHNMTVYLPYGEQWQAYYSRRLSERKENIFFVLKNFFRS